MSEQIYRNVKKDIFIILSIYDSGLGLEGKKMCFCLQKSHYKMDFLSVF